MIAPLRWLLWLIGLGVAAFAVSWLFTMPGKDIRGTWATDGYGLHLDIGRAVIDIYEVTDISCHRAQRIPAHIWMIRATQDITLTRDDNRLRIDAGGMLGPIMADQTTGLPQTCPQTPPVPGSARDNFDVLWQAMAENYAFFDLHGVDWAQRRAAMRPAPDSRLSDDALLEVFKDTLAGLDDGHVTIRTNDGAVHSPARRPDWFADRHMVRDNTLAQFDDLRTVANTGLLYGWAAPEIGYVYMTHMDTSGGINAKATDQARDGFAEIALAFAAADGIILDLRYNPGGSDDVALAFASYFTDRPVTALTKTTRTANGITPPHSITLQPQDRFHMDQPTVILTSGFTMGAAEVFAMTMRQLPQVTLMGTPTAGAFSDVASFTLPNGWVLGLSHQEYRDAAGVIHEGTGIAPDIAANVDVTAARAGQDSTLQAAIAWLARQDTVSR